MTNGRLLKRIVICVGLLASAAVVLQAGPASAAGTRYEAETPPAACDGTIDSNHSGFSGSGFCNTGNYSGAAVQFTVSASTAKSATLRIKFANGSTAGRSADVLVNGTRVQSTSFEPTGAWSTWAWKTWTVSLTSGGNTIRFVSTNSNGMPNVDYLDVSDDSGPPPAGKQMEDLDRGLVSVRSGSGNLVSWRMLGADPSSVSFNLYRGSTRVFSGSATNYHDAGASSGSSYTVRAVVDGVEQPASPPSLNFTNGYLDVPLQRPPGGSAPDGSYTYSPGDASVGDLDGDGQLEIVLKWDPSNAHDNAHDGYTGPVLIDAYKLNGQRMWRINLGRNIRAGAHYTQFQVYDYDGDGRSELAVKTADATVSGTGQVIGNGSADHRNSAGRILTGPEFLTVFRGTDGAVLDTENFSPARGNICDWGDCYGNRGDRFLAGTAYLDGQRPSIVMARGYYTKAVIAAWDFRNGQLTRRWIYDSGSGGAYGQGNHQLSIADVDADGRDEIVYGSATINDNGALMYSTGYGHGDALHVGDLIPSRAGIEVYTIHEPGGSPAADVHDGRTGSIIWRRPSNGGDEGPGRGVAGDIYAGSPGAEFWGYGPTMTNLFNTSGSAVGRTPSSANFLAWWDGDPVRELLDATRIDKYGASGETRLLTGSGVASINGTKATPVISGDLFGDWREEVIWRTTDNTRLRIYSTPHRTDRRLVTLLHDPQYRVALAWQNTAYNQPPHPSYFIGNGMAAPPQPTIYLR